MTKTMITAPYPCGCGRSAQFTAIECVPVEKYDARCRICKTKWTVTRTTLREGPECRPGVQRVDKLEWEIVPGAHPMRPRRAGYGR